MSQQTFSIESLSPFARKINVMVPAPEVKERFGQVFAEIRKSAHLKGYRPGKAPLATIKSAYMLQAEQEVVDSLIRKHYVNALVEHKLVPVNKPEFEFDRPLEDQGFSFSVTFEVNPEVKLKNYENFVLEKEKFEVDEKMLDSTLENIRKNNAQWIDLPSPRPAQIGDTAVLNFEGFMDAAPLENGSGTDFSLELGSKRFIPGFEEGIVGMSISEKKTLKLKFPSEYSEASLAGKDVDFAVELVNLKQREIPELTTEFLQTLGFKDKTVEEFRALVKSDLENSENKRIEEEFKERLVQKLIAENPFEVPPSLIAKQKEALVSDAKDRWVKEGANLSEFDAYASKWDEDFTKSAKEVLQASLLIRAIAEKNDLFPTDEEVSKRLDEYAQRTGMERARIEAFYGKEENDNRLRSQMTEDKVIALVTSTAVIREVPPSKAKK